MGTNVDNSVVLQSDDRHPYSGITLSEWGASNTRIMAHLLKSGQLAADKIDYYLAYTTTIFEYYELYEWEGVLEFDHSYRERQAEHQFQWGYIPPHMELSLLARPRRPASRHNGPSGAFIGGTSRASRGPSPGSLKTRSAGTGKTLGESAHTEMSASFSTRHSNLNRTFRASALT